MGWVRRWVEVTVALVVSKLVLVLIFVVGYFMLVQGVGQAGSGVSQQVTQVVAGAIVLALAGFAPVACVASWSISPVTTPSNCTPWRPRRWAGQWPPGGWPKGRPGRPARFASIGERLRRWADGRGR